MKAIYNPLNKSQKKMAQNYVQKLMDIERDWYVAVTESLIFLVLNEEEHMGIKKFSKIMNKVNEKAEKWMVWGEIMSRRLDAELRFRRANELADQLIEIQEQRNGGIDEYINT